MKKILLIISMLLLMSACGEIETSNSVSIPKQPDNDNGSVIEPGGDNGTIDPGGDNGTIDPGGDNGTIDPGGDNGTIDPGGDNGTIDPGGDNGTIDPGGDGNDNGTTTEPVFDYTKDPFKANLYYGRSLLTAEEQKAYDLLMKTFLAFEVTSENTSDKRIKVDLKANNIYVTNDQLVKICKYVLDDEQRLTYLITQFNPRGDGTSSSPTPVQTENGYVTVAYFDVFGFMMSTAQSVYKYQSGLIESGVKVILDRLKPDMNEGQKFRLLHDEFIKSVSYGQLTVGTNDIRGGFGPDKKVLCEGYARSLAYLCQRAGLEVIYVVGTASYDGTGDDGSGSAFNHAWIKVKIDGQWYNVDPTNNDGMSAGSSYVYYNNFLQSDAEFMKDHTEGVTTAGSKVSYDTFPKSATTSYDKNATDYP